MTMNWNGKKVLVVGSGISGISASCLLGKMGAYPYLYDENKEKSKEELIKKTKGYPKEIILGEMPEKVLEEIELGIFSPGAPVDSPLGKKLKEKKIPIWGEVELAYVCSKGNVIAITGTNGKTTTTALVGAIMKSYFKEVYVVGNIGIPYTENAEKRGKEAVSVAEISSFQLETIHSFRPKVAAILNITPDHLDRHHTMENYIAMKERIGENQTKEDIIVLNYDDPNTKKVGEKAKGRVRYFSCKNKLEDGIFLEKDSILYKEGSFQKEVLKIGELKLLGEHNVENVMAGLLIALSFGVPLHCAQKVVKEFQGVEHRIEFVAEKKGVCYYNDSKGTNVDAAIKAIKAMRRNTVLIGGGYDKGAKYDEWIQSFEGKVKHLILIGQTKEKIADCAKKHGFSSIDLVDTLEEAVNLSAKRAYPGEAVLLSPACASWGMFSNYEERGNQFKDYVNHLKED